MSGRTLIGIEVTAVLAEDGESVAEMVLECLCDCGAATTVLVDGVAPTEFAFTCDGCQSTHWITPSAGAGETP